MRLSLLFVLLCTGSLVAQERITTLDVFTGIGYGYRYNVDLLDNGTTTNPDDDTGRINWRAGIAINREVATNWHLRVGLNLSSMGYRPVNENNPTSTTELDELFISTPDPGLFDEIKVASVFTYVEVPFAIRYELAREGFAPFVEVGLVPAFLASSKDKVYLDDERTSINRVVGQFQSEFTIGMLLSVGGSIPLGERTRLYAQPSFFQHFNDSQEIPFRLSLLEVGLQAGVRYLLR